MLPALSIAIQYGPESVVAQLAMDTGSKGGLVVILETLFAPALAV